MNAFTNSDDPTDSFFGGLEMGERLNDARARARRAMLDEQERAALAQMGQGDQLAGFDGVEGAVRPPWLKTLYQTNPQAALQQEHLVAEPFRTNRDVQKAMDIERNKGQVHMDTVKNMLASFFGDHGPSEAGPMPASASPVSMTEGGSPQAGAMPAGGGAMPPPNLMGLSGRKPKLKYGPQVFEISMEDMSPLEKALAVSDNEMKRQDRALNEKNYDLSVEKQIGEKAKLANEFDTSRFNKINELHKQENELSKRIDQLKLQKSGGDISPRDYLDSANSIMADMKALRAQKESLLRGNGEAEQTLAMNTKDYRNPSSRQPQAVVPATKATRDLPASAPEQMAAPSMNARASAEPALPYKQQVEVQREKLKGDLAQTRSILDAAHASANSALQNKPATDRIMELLQKNDLGSRIFKLPGGETASTIFSGNYDELNKWRQSLILQEKSEGESQLYNTLPELKIHSASLPSVDNDENTNRRAIVPVKNLMEARLVAPQFLEDWAKQHGGTLDGARQAFRSWMQHNPMYQTAEKNGQVSIHENTHFIPLDIWTRLRQRFSENDLLKKRDSGGIQVIHGRAFFKE